MKPSELSVFFLQLLMQTWFKTGNLPSLFHCQWCIVCVVKKYLCRPTNYLMHCKEVKCDNWGGNKNYWFLGMGDGWENFWLFKFGQPEERLQEKGPSILFFDMYKKWLNSHRPTTHCSKALQRIFESWNNLRSVSQGMRKPPAKIIQSEICHLKLRNTLDLSNVDGENSLVVVKELILKKKMVLLTLAKV